MLENIALRRFQHNYHNNIAKEGSPVSGLYPTFIESFKYDAGPHKPFQRVNLFRRQNLTSIESDVYGRHILH